MLITMSQTWVKTYMKPARITNNRNTLLKGSSVLKHVTYLSRIWFSRQARVVPRRNYTKGLNANTNNLIYPEPH